MFFLNFIMLEVVEEHIDVETIEDPLHHEEDHATSEAAEVNDVESNDMEVDVASNAPTNGDPFEPHDLSTAASVSSNAAGNSSNVETSNRRESVSSDTTQPFSYDDYIREREDETRRWVHLNQAQTRDEQLKKKIDDYLKSSSKGLYIDPDIVGYAMVNHQYMLMTPVERKRLNDLRIEITRVQTLIAQSNNQIPTDPICPVCFDEIKFKPVYVLPCGHSHCTICLERIQADDPSDVGNCAICGSTVGDDFFRLYLSYRQ